jgi:hypothetical protein
VNVKTGASLYVEKTERLLIDGFVSAKPIAGAPLICLTNVQDALLQNSWPFTGTKSFVEIKGSNTKNIIIRNNTLDDAEVNVSEDVKKEEVKQ